jgi:LPS-assembly protein
MKFTRLILLPCAASALALHAQNLPEVASPETAAAAAGGLEGARDLVAKLGGDVNIRSLGGAEVVDFEKGIFRYRDSVNIKYRGVEILANGADFNRSTGDISVAGDVAIYRQGMLYKGSSAVYNINNDTITSDNLRSSLLAAEREIYFQTRELASNLGDAEMPELIESRASYMTTHDSSHPNWHIEAEKMDVYPEDKIVFRNLKVYAGGTPVFWLPYLSQPMDDELGYSFSPGYDSAWGAYLLNRYGSLLGEDGHTLATYRLDLRSDRGVAGGIDLRSMRHRDNEYFGLLRGYYANDLDPTISRNSRERLDAPEENRYRLSLQHRFYLRGYDDSVTVQQETGRRVKNRSSVPIDESFFVDADFDLLSDEFFLEDFFPEEFRINPQPDNFLNFVKTHPLGSLSLMGRLRINDFYQSDTRLPELALDTVRTPVFGSGFFYEGTSSFGILEEQVPEQFASRQNARVQSLGEDLARYESDPGFTVLNPEFDPVETRTLLDQLQLGLAERAFNRFDTYHQVSHPLALGPVSVVPRVGVRYTNYSDVSGASAGSTDRGLIHAGVDASIKFSRESDTPVTRALGLDGLRHVVQPYLRYSLVEGDEMDPRFPSIDRLTPTTRPRPIDLASFPAIDTIGNWDLVRLGTFNTWQTRVDGSTRNWLEMNTYIDTYFEDPEFDRDFSNLYHDLTWLPLPWLRVDLRTQFDVFGEEAGFNEFNSAVTWMPTSNFDLSLGHRYLDDHPFLTNSNQVNLRGFYRLADEWGFSFYQRWELDDSTLETQQYSIHKDLVSWTAALGAVMRDNRGEDEFGVVLTMTLKEFPQVALPINLDPQGAAAD